MTGCSLSRTWTWVMGCGTRLACGAGVTRPCCSLTAAMAGTYPYGPVILSESVRESDIAYRWARKESNLVFTLSSDKDQRQKFIGWASVDLPVSVHIPSLSVVGITRSRIPRTGTGWSRWRPTRCSEAQRSPSPRTGPDPRSWTHSKRVSRLKSLRKLCFERHFFWPSPNS